LWAIFRVAGCLSRLYIPPGDLINFRQIHLAFAVFPSAMAYPLFTPAPETTSHGMIGSSARAARCALRLFHVRQNRQQRWFGRMQQTPLRLLA
jgi:hypothetical protein